MGYNSGFYGKKPILAMDKIPSKREQLNEGQCKTQHVHKKESCEPSVGARDNHVKNDRKQRGRSPLENNDNG